ncbi:MAG: glucose-6-phosphate dehydrogenase assembly protein OpcA [Actinomycetota bacterium]|nr:glucose-6-phosphate dehydrogenase assembly protein OpcA [Actinomycetota bacterium]
MIRLEDTSGGAVAAAIAAERHRMGSSATGMVLTLLILSDEEAQADATAAAVGAARQHPMRIVTLIPRPGRQETRLDADISVGGDDGPGEVAVLRLRGLLAEHANSVAVPLLLSDTPVVAFWPEDPPDVPADDPIGRHAQRRITDAAGCEDPIRALAHRKKGYRPGDTDLTWTRITPWRSALASLFDQPVGKVTGGHVSSEEGNASALLLTLWLHHFLKVPIEQQLSDGPGITEVHLSTVGGDISISRSDGATAVLSRPGAPESRIALHRRDLADLLSEELRRLDPDEVYGEVLGLVADA